MPTPVGIARQCLTQEASSALDEAVAVARRRSHSQTTSLHLISAFLSFPTSSLRDACSRVRSSAYAPRFQFKALELCFGSALDRLPSSQSSNNESEPPISNSLMAAIKRSQAHQRRNPESFHLYQQQQQQQNSSLNCVKVEVQQLVLSILDDPIVSRVFAEAGFRSCDIKIAILRPLPPLSRFQRSRRAPLFLCNLTEGGDSDFAARNFNFPFLGCSESSEVDENFRRIGEVLARKKERNPLLVGVYANQALRSFSEIVQRGRAGSVPAELSGLSLLCIEKEIHKFISEGGSEGLLLGAKFEELHHLIGNCCGPGVVLSFGDLSVLLDDNSIDSVGYVVSQLSKLSELHREKLWLMGAVASYEMYLKFLMMFPSIAKDWDLQILPITSLKTPPPLGGFQSRPQSLMESFVPFGGFFSTTSDMSSPFTTTYQPISRCHLCNEKYEQEVSAFSNGGCTPSVADQYNASLPSWLQKGELNASKGFDMTQAKDDGTVFNAKVTGLQKKWNDICRRLHHCPAIAKDDYRVRPQGVSGTMGFPFLSDRKEDANSLSSSSDIRAIPNKNDCENAQPSTSIESHKISSPTQKTPEPLVSEAKNENYSCKTTRDSRTECSRTENPRFPLFPFPSVTESSCDNPSPSTTIPVTTDLGLGTLYASTCKEPDKDWLQKSSNISPEKVDVARPNISNPSIQSPSCSGAEQVDPNDVKSLWRCLMDKVGRQNEAIHTISQTISRCRTGNERRRGASLKRDVWFSFIGLDRVAKRRIVLALAEVVFGRKQNVISVDLSSQDGLTHSNTVFGCREMNGYDAKLRGKMVVDYTAEEISKKPLSIVFLENINKADMLLQNSLSLAIKTGKFSDSRGREVSVNNTIFVATSSSAAKDTTSPSVEENTCTKYSEERILKAQNLEMQILIGHVGDDNNIKMKFSNVLVTSKKETRIPSFLNKRKLVEGSDISEKGDTRDWLGRAKKTPKCLDLNLPVNETETIDLEYDSSESDAVSENSEMWLEEFLAQMDGSVMFKPFDFDTLANTLLKEINAVVRNTIGPDCLVEIDSQVMEQILAASWLSDRERAVEDWVQQILGRSLIEAQQRYAFTSQSVLKLVTCDGQYVRDQAHGVCLPSRIIVNL